MDQNELNRALKEGIALKKDANRLIDEAKLKTTEEIALFKKTNVEYKNIVQRLKDVNSEIKESRDLQKQTVDTYVQQEKTLKGLSGLQASLVGHEQKRIGMMANMKNLDSDKRETFQSIADLQNELLQTSAEDVIAQDSINAQLDEKYKSLGKVQGVHSHIVKNLKEQRSIAEGVASLTEGQQEQLNAQIAVYDGIKKSIGGVLDTARLLTSNLSAGIGFAVIGLGQAVGKIGEMNKQFGLTLFSTDGIARNTALMNVFFDDAAGTSEELASQFGSTEAASFKTQLNTNLLARNLGISGKEAATLVGSFSRLNGNSTDIANDLIVSTRELAKQNGVIPSKVMADLANSTEAFALYGKNGGKNIAQAAVYAAKLGVGMDKLTGIADNLLDFESSITKELELSTLLGRNINLNQARQLAYAGDIEAATAETLRQLGGIDAFNRMDYFQKKASADLLGVSVAELQQMVQNQDKANEKATVFGETYSMLNEKATALSNIMGGPFLSTLGSGLVALGQMGFNVKGMLASISKKIGLQKLYNFLINGELITRSKNWIGEKLSAGVQLLKNGYQSVYNVLVGSEVGIKRSSWMMDKLSAGWQLAKLGYQKIKLSLMGKETAMLVKQRMLSEKQIASGFGGKKAKDMLLSKSGGIVGDKSPLSTTTKPTMESPIGKKGGIMDSMSKIKMNDVLKGAAAILILSAALFVAAKAFQEFGDVEWPAVTLGLAGLAGMATIALVLGKAQGEMIKGAIGVAILGVALIPFAYAMSLIAGLDIGSVISAAAGLVIFSAAVFGLGTLMMTGVGAFIFGAGLLALAGLGAAMMVLGAGLLVAGSGFQAIGNSMGSIIPSISQIGDVLQGIFAFVGPMAMLSLSLGTLSFALIGFGMAGLIAAPGLLLVGAGIMMVGTGLSLITTSLATLSGGLTSVITAMSTVGSVIGEMFQYIVPIAALSLALGGLALALTAVGVAGIAALPGLMAVAAVGTIAMGVGSLLGFGGGGTEADNGMDELLTEIKGLRADLNSGKVAVYMDGKKVSSSVNRVMDKIGTNFYGAT